MIWWMLFLLLLTSSVIGIPRQVGFQGRQTDATGAPVPDGFYDVKFTLYDQPSGGNVLWTTGSYVPIQLRNGLFSHSLGATSPLPDSLAKYDSLWLGISIGVDPEIVPRSPLASVPFSFRALQADRSDRADSAVFSTTADTANVLHPSSIFRRLAADSSGGTTSSNSFVQVGSTLSLAPGAVTNFVFVTTRVECYLQSGSSYCGNTAGHYQLRVGLAGSEIAVDEAEVGRLSANYLTNTGESATLQYYYVPSTQEKATGFNVKIYLRLTNGNALCSNPWIALRRCEVLGW